MATIDIPGHGVPACPDALRFVLAHKSIATVPSAVAKAVQVDLFATCLSSGSGMKPIFSAPAVTLMPDTLVGSVIRVSPVR